MAATAPVKKVPIHLQSSHNRLLIKNGKVVNADGMADADLYIEEGVIKQLGRNLIIPGGTRTIDAAGLLLLPGGIDPHTHLDVEFMGTKSADDFYQGTKAAVAGGTTMIIDFVLPAKEESLIDAYYEWRRRADEKVCCDYGLHVAVTWWSSSVKKEMEELVEKHGVNSFKSFLAYKGSYQLSDTELYHVFNACKELGALPMVHAENGDIIAENTKKLLNAGITGPEGHEMSRPEEVEAEATNRACVIANQVESPIYVTRVMSRSSGEVIKTRRAEGQVVFGETLASAVALSGAPPHNKSFLRVTSPPLRPDPNTPEHLLMLLNDDGLQLTGSDNCTFTAEQKAVGKENFTKIPNGVNGVEDRMSVVWEKGVETGIIDPPRFVAITSTNAAKIFNIYPKKGVLAVGSDADIVLWNPRKTRTISAKTHHHKTDYNIFEGLTCHGVPDYVIVGGRVCVDEGELKAVQGLGNFVPTPTFSPTCYPAFKPEENGIDKNAIIHEEIAALRLNNTSSKPSSVASSVFGDDAQSNVRTGKGMRQDGQRDLQGSSFSISSEVAGDGPRSSIRVHNPPGGKSAGGFW
ncbi:dihydropyrimidinase isoform X2 [Bemisia tabaci]|uniref:dihydropyrimidinase isoform X2 n=1 Tax=Bemisia tabaci TaxID=7038 RepID=UPI0008F9D18D|nr:PREDICTED: dihydropyrimidinase isoform X2 [Bemisia tabaci]